MGDLCIMSHHCILQVTALPVLWVQPQCSDHLPLTPVLLVPYEWAAFAVLLYRHTADKSAQGGRKMPHKRIMTTPTQLWHNALDPSTWQPKSASDDCAIPLKERRTHVSLCCGISPLWLPLVSQAKSVFSLKPVIFFQWNVGWGGDGVSTHPF